MTDQLDEPFRYRMERSREALEDARILADAGRWNACVNRLFYSCFYAVSALLIQHGLSSAKHTGVRSLFNKHFVKTGIVPKELAQVYNDLFERRQEGDYVDFVHFDETQIRPWISRTEKFINHIAAILEDSKAWPFPRWPEQV